MGLYRPFVAPCSSNLEKHSQGPFLQLFASSAQFQWSLANERNFFCIALSFCNHLASTGTFTRPVAVQCAIPCSHSVRMIIHHSSYIYVARPKKELGEPVVLTLWQEQL
jgi:hypothetical protein